MLHELLITVGGFIANEVFNRVKYSRQLKRIATESAKRLPKGDTRYIVEQALIEANQREMAETIKHIDAIKANAASEWRDAVRKAEAEAAAKREGK